MFTMKMEDNRNFLSWRSCWDCYLGSPTLDTFRIVTWLLQCWPGISCRLLCPGLLDLQGHLLCSTARVGKCAGAPCKHHVREYTLLYSTVQYSTMYITKWGISFISTLILIFLNINSLIFQYINILNILTSNQILESKAFSIFPVSVWKFLTKH